MNRSSDVIITVTNDINSDRRMIRIASTLVQSGRSVLLVGRKTKKSKVLSEQTFSQHRLICAINRGPLFYLEYNLRLITFLFRHRPKLLYSVDLDTVLGISIAARVMNKSFIFDSHEDFTEVPELSGKYFKKWIWKWVGKFSVPHAGLCLTVGGSLAEKLQAMFEKPFYAIRNVPEYKNTIVTNKSRSPITIVYQGMINMGRGLEVFIDAIEDYPLIEFLVIGEGDEFENIKEYAGNKTYQNRVIFEGWVQPQDLHSLTSKATIGLNILDSESESYYNSLANKFFDYIMAGIPVLTMNFPEYQILNQKYNVAYLIDNIRKSTINIALNKIISEPEELEHKSIFCLKAKEELHWGNEATKLMDLVENKFKK